MTTNPLDSMPKISIQDLENLSFGESKLKVVIKHFQGYYMPIVYQNLTDGGTKLHGVVVQDDHVLATKERDDIIKALIYVIGYDHTILTDEEIAHKAH